MVAIHQVLFIIAITLLSSISLNYLIYSYANAQDTEDPIVNIPKNDCAKYWSPRMVITKISFGDYNNVCNRMLDLYLHNGWLIVSTMGGDFSGGTEQGHTWILLVRPTSVANQ